MDAEQGMEQGQDRDRNGFPVPGAIFLHAVDRGVAFRVCVTELLKMLQLAAALGAVPELPEEWKASLPEDLVPGEGPGGEP